MITALLIVLAAAAWIVISVMLFAAALDKVYGDDPRVIFYLLALVFWVLTPLTLAATR